MNVILFICTVAVARILYYLIERTYRFYLFYQQINKIPGPEIGIPFFGTIYKYMNLKKEDRLEWLKNMIDQYNDGIMRLWMGFNATIHIRKPEHIKLLLSSNTQITKGRGYTYLKDWLGYGLGVSTGAQWFHSRKMISPTLHVSILDEFSEVMIDKAKILNKCIEKAMKINGEKPVDIFPLALKCTLDIICETVMGDNINAQEGTDSDYIKSVHIISSGVQYRFVRPWLKLNSIYFRTSPGREFKKAVDTTYEFCTRMINKKQQLRKCNPMRSTRTKENGIEEFGTRKKMAFLDLLLEANEKEEDPMSIEEIRDQANMLIFAGHDTTGGALGWALFCLGNDLDVQRKVHEELDQVLGDLNDQDTLSQLSNLKYLERVIKETLRLYPSGPHIGRTLNEDMQIGNHIVPCGADLEIQIYQLHRDASVWPDPLRFDPDRFLPENTRKRGPYAFIPFSAGPRNCVGQKFAMLEAKIVLAQVLRKFRVKSVENHETIKKHDEIVLKPTNGLYIHFTNREETI